MFATNSDGRNKLGCLERDYSVCKTLKMSANNYDGLQQSQMFAGF